MLGKIQVVKRNKVKSLVVRSRCSINENKLTVNGPVYESYLNDPSDTLPTKLMTELLFSI